MDLLSAQHAEEAAKKKAASGGKAADAKATPPKAGKK
jgi:hypothetical protein